MQSLSMLIKYSLDHEQRFEDGVSMFNHLGLRGERVEVEGARPKRNNRVLGPTWAKVNFFPSTAPGCLIPCSTNTNCSSEAISSKFTYSMARFQHNTPALPEQAPWEVWGKFQTDYIRWPRLSLTPETPRSK